MTADKGTSHTTQLHSIPSRPALLPHGIWTDALQPRTGCGGLLVIRLCPRRPDEASEGGLLLHTGSMAVRQGPCLPGRWPGPRRAACRAVSPPLRAWDRRSALSATRYLTSSSAVADDVRNAYGLEATVLPPPMQADPAGEQDAVRGLEAGFFSA